MKNLLTKMLLVAVVAFGFVGIGALQPSLAYAAPADEVCKGADLDGTGCAGGEAAITRLANTVINVFSWIVGIVSVIMVIWGGFQFVTSGGDSTRAGRARMTIFYAVIGLVVVAMAQIIVKFVIGTFAK